MLRSDLRFKLQAGGTNVRFICRGVNGSRSSSLLYSMMKVGRMMRRQTAKIVSALVIMVLLAGYLPLAGEGLVARAETSNDFDLMRSKWKEILTGGAFNDPNDPDVRKLVDSTAAAATNSNGTGQWDTLNKSPQRTSLWDDLTSTTASAHITSNYNRIKTMAKAYGVIGSPFYGNEALRDDIVSALEWMYVNRYNETKTAYDNWWDWELGTPMELNDIMVIMFDALSVEQVDKFSRAVLKFSPAVKPSDTGANRVWRSTVLGLSGVLNRDEDSIAAARDGLSDVFLYVNSGDGFYEDGSFIQHNKHPYNGGYGKALLGTIANIMYMLNGSPWEITDPNKQNVYRWVKDSFEPLIYNGAFMDMVRGREVSRLQSQDHVIGHLTISAIIRLAKSASPADKFDFERMAKKWILNDGYRNYIGNANLGIISEAKALIFNPAIPAGDKLLLNKVFPAMDRVVHHTEDFAFGLSLSSSRTFKYESINKENLKGWYTSDGMTYLYNGDQSQYSDGFWATVNPYRLPGTTVDTRERLAQTSANYAASNLWAGGTVMEDVYGIAGLDLDADGNQLTAKKSWFMFDDEIVALGAGITSNENRTIETIVENRKLNQTGNNVLTVNGAVKLGTEGSAETMSGTNWAHLAGKAPDSDIGYYFPGSAQIKGLREKRTGAWSDINQNTGTPASITNHFLNLWFDHGVNPNRAEYAYVLLPKRDAAQTAAYSENPDIQIVKNTEVVQAVRENKLGIIGANFWAPGRVEYLKTYQPASVIVKEEADQLVVSISDPTQAQEQIIVELSKAGTSVISQDPSITVLNMSPVKIAVNTAGSQGSTHTIRIAYDPSLMRPDKKLYPVADTYVDKGNPNASFGTSPLLAVNGGDPVQETFLRFNLDSLSGEIDAAALKVYGGVSDPQGVTVQNDVYAVLQNGWTETGAGSIAWLNRPQFGLRLGSFDANEIAGWADVNVTDYVRTQHTGDHKAGFAITQSSPGLYTTISSKEGSDPEVHPYLAVKEYTFNGAQLDRIQASIVGPDVLRVGTSTSLTISGTKEDGSPADLTQASVAYNSSDPSAISVDGSGIVTALRAGSGTITVTVSMNSRVKSATVHFIATTNGLETQEIVAVADSYVDKSNPNNNYGSAMGLPVTSNGASTREAYFKFDLSQVRGKVHTAKLKIWATNSDAKGGMKENKVYQTGNDWNESTITWNNTPARGALLGSANIDPGWKWHEIDVTSAVYGQVDQTGNFSFLVRQEEKPVMSPFSARKRQVSGRI